MCTKGELNAIGHSLPVDLWAKQRCNVGGATNKILLSKQTKEEQLITYTYR